MDPIIQFRGITAKKEGLWYQCDAGVYIAFYDVIRQQVKVSINLWSEGTPISMFYNDVENLEQAVNVVKHGIKQLQKNFILFPEEL